MPLRYHLVYYAVFVLLLSVAYLVHPLFYIFLLAYLIYLVKRFGRKMLFLLFLLPIILRPATSTEVPSIVSGKVKDVRDNYVILNTGYGKIKAYTDHKFQYNDEVLVKLNFLEIKHRKDPIGYDEYHSFKANNIVAKAKITHITSVSSHPSFYQLLEKQFSSSKSIKSYQKLFILGIKDDAIKEDYSLLTSLSLVHMFALSGMHIHLLYKCLGLIKSFIRDDIADIIVKVLMGFYVFSIPYNISLHRAFYMLVINDLVKEKFNQLDVLSFLVLVNVIKNPYIIFSISFVFSYFIYFLVIMTKHFPYRSFLIYLGGIPIVLSLNFSINIFSYFLTVLLSPFISCFYIVTLLSLIFPIDLIMKMMIGYQQMILTFITSLNAEIIFQKPTLSFIILYYIILFNIFLLLEEKKSIQFSMSLLCALLISFHIYSIYKPYTQVSTIDVGQGDCSLIRLPFNHGNYLIDTGGNREYDIASHNVIPYLKSQGIPCIDRVYISHHDYDHYGALDSLKKKYKVKRIIDTYQKEEKNKLITIKMLKNDVIYPSTNENSLVMLVTTGGYNYLFTGDIPSNVEEDLYKKYGEIDVDVLKVAHHGSGYSSSVTFFQMVHPRIAMIGVGEHNLYGHPARIVIKRLEERKIKILRTDLDGSFSIITYLGEHLVYRY